MDNGAHGQHMESVPQRRLVDLESKGDVGLVTILLHRTNLFVLTVDTFYKMIQRLVPEEEPAGDLVRPSAM